MEIAQDVRELLVGSPTEQQLLEDMQNYHLQYCNFQQNLATQVAELDMGPESRIFYYQLQQSMYKDWTAAITDCAFKSSTCNTKTLEEKLATYEKVVACTLGEDGDASSLIKDPTMEQWIHKYEDHRKKFS
ncbi:unnamed protein product [Aphanomyces euteiches]|uniref:Uncharacterized protein n=1 Tax=Aphanomyces euteiches TaxID=100861 RepID=A0A6G0XIR1_9STRA|nr:hypothetical protein Ae201684_004378 [Aphanomyces euteiches]KAG9411807.1 hypothetical protein AC1031_017436 [Aphanomyces cochlioides]KAH9093715.1 hypothetical protein Ae201684P_016338 [Aphanomyces euteiches]KAH9126398.1 hypothetical protein AeMF1_003171 [Aphanomyces euteiches]KAH9140330.1 hypothetical protein LEN26_005287 [Aphanomyces euteiches]